MSDPVAPAPPPPPALTEDQTSGRMFLRWNGAWLAAGVVALGAGVALERARPPASLPATSGDPLRLAADARWDDGKAEVARYAARRDIYGEPRTYELVRVVVKEPFDPAARVKPDLPRPAAVDVLKVVAAHEVPTGRLYEHRQALFTHVLRSDPRRVLSHTASSQEWCGSTFQVIARREGGLVRTVHSYWDGEGDFEDRLGDEVWLEDQLPFTLRALDPAASPMQVELLPSTLGGHAPRDARPVAATIQAGAPESITTPAGTFSCVAWTVSAGGRALRYWVGLEGERPLVRYDDRTGTGELTKLERLTYWQ